jgi:ABC-2 type transport system ATP-binding protein
MDRLDLTLAVDSAAIQERWRNTTGVHSLSAQDGQLILLVEDSNLVLPRLFESAGQLGVRVNSVNIQEPNLEAVFLHLTGKALRD